MKETIGPASTDAPARDALVEAHLGYVRALALKLRQEIDTDVELDELIAFGVQGLLEAADRFDAARGVAFTTFSYYRIRGAIFDGLRQSGWLSRRQYARFVAQSNELLGNVADRDAAAGSGETRTEDALAAVADTLDQVTTVFLCAFSADEDVSLLTADNEDVSTRLEREQAARLVREGIGQLPAKERELLELCYFKGLNLKDAGARLGLSKSWASRLHTRAVRLLTEALGPAFGIAT